MYRNSAAGSNAAPHCVFIVDDHPVVCRGLISLVNAAPDLVVCGSARALGEAMRKIGRARPDLVTVDLSLGASAFDIDAGYDLISTLHGEAPNRPILVVSFFDEHMVAGRAAQMGARGYVRKDQAATTLLGAIRRLLNGETYFNRSPEMPIV